MVTMTRRELIHAYICANNQIEKEITGFIVNLTMNDLNPSINYVIEDKLIIKGITNG